MQATVLLALSLLTCQPSSISQDPAQVTARKALSGAYGILQPFQRQGYTLIRDRGTTVQGKAFVTHYWAAEGRDGQVDRYGNRCTLRTAAANLLPRKAYVWISNPAQLRQVLDRGAARNDRVARGKHCQLWIDVWHIGPKGNYIAQYAAVSP